MFQRGNIAKNKLSGQTVRVLHVVEKLEDDGDLLIDEPCALIEYVGPTKETDNIHFRLMSMGFSAYTPLSNLESVAVVHAAGIGFWRSDSDQGYYARCWGQGPVTNIIEDVTCPTCSGINESLISIELGKGS